MIELDPYMKYVPALMLVLFRVTGIFVVAPVFSDAAVPPRLRYLMGVVISLAAVGRLAGPVELSARWIDLVAGAAGEFLIGATIGYVARLVFAGVELGAFHIGQQMGVSLGEVFDPMSQAPSDAVRRLFQMLCVVIFLGIGGHRMLISSLLATFQAVPLMGLAPDGGLLDMVVMLLGASFVLALKVAAPVLIAMLLATLALGMLQKALPQCNILSIGLSVRAILGLGVLGVGLAALAALMESFLAILGSGISAWMKAVQ